MKPITIDAFLQYRFLSGIQFSPDGRHAAYVVSQAKEDQRGYHSELWLYDAETGKTRPLTAGGQENAFCWTDAQTLLFAAQRTEVDKKAAEKGPYTAFYSLPIDGGEARFAFGVPLKGASAMLLAQGLLLRGTVDRNAREETPEDAPKADVSVLEELPYWANGKGIVSGKRSALYHYAPDTAALTPLSTDAVGAVAADPAGRRVAYAVTVYDSVNPQRQAVRLWDAETGETREVLAGDTYGVSHIAFMGDGLVLSMADDTRYGTSENDRLYFLNLQTNKLTLAAAPDRDISGNAGWDCRLGGGRTFVVCGDRLYLTLGVDNGPVLYTMDAQGALAAITDGTGTLDCFDVHEGKVLCIAMRGMGLQELYRLDGGTFVPCTDHNGAALRDCAISMPAPLSFANADGIRIDGWVLTPPDFDPTKSYPAIFNIHGGPKAIFGPVFFHEMQYWAGLGYVVFFCNPRGSGGRGDAFADLRGKYGTIDYDDLMAFADKVLAAYPAIDPSRVCVAGGSYGGFAVNWIIGHTNRFAAAASQRSIANWTSKCLTTDIGYYHNLSQIDGDPWNTPERFWEKSPLKYAPQVQTPTLFIHSDEDYRCWMAEGLQMFTALKMHGVRTRLCLFSGENHELSRSGKPVNRIRRLREITDWFDAHTGRQA